jgi:adenosine deaminase
VQTSTVASYASHPLPRFLDLGILATINTDDPTASGLDLDYELEVAAPRAGLTPAQVRQARRNSLEIAFLTKQEKEDLIHAASADADPGSDAVGGGRHREGAEAD